MKSFAVKLACKECRFWTRYYNSEDKGKCRRYTPEIKYTGWGALTFWGFNTDAEGIWPQTGIDDWCGEFEAKEQPTTQTQENL